MNSTFIGRGEAICGDGEGGIGVSFRSSSFHMSGDVGEGCSNAEAFDVGMSLRGNGPLVTRVHNSDIDNTKYNRL